jgi:hypothetical protein
VSAAHLGVDRHRAYWEYVVRVVAAAPPLTERQRERLRAALLGSVGCSDLTQKQSRRAARPLRPPAQAVSTKPLQSEDRRSLFDERATERWEGST